MKKGFFATQTKFTAEDAEERRGFFKSYFSAQLCVLCVSDVENIQTEGT